MALFAVLLAFTGMLTYGAVPAAGAASGSELTNETFEGSSVTDSRWVGFGDACVTGAPAGAASPAGASNLGGCRKSVDSPVLGTDPGYLQLTDNSGGSTSNVLYDRAFPSSAGLVISFTQYQYATSGTGLGPADGIGFFLTDGAYTLDQPGPTGGGSGGALGYATIAGQDGIENGYLGVGLDVYGNFSRQPYVGEACEASHSSAAQSVAVRGPGNGSEGYCLLSSTPYPNLRGSDLSDAGREVEIVVSPTSAEDPYPTITVSIDGSVVSTVQMTVPAPPTFKMGFSASTGGGHEVHLVKLFAVSTVDPLGAISLVKSVDHSTQTGTTKTTFTEGDRVPYSFLVTNTGSEEALRNIVLSDPKIVDVVCPATTLAIQDSFVCTGTYGPLTAEEAHAGSFENTATVNGTTTVSSTPVEDTSTAVVPTYVLNTFEVSKTITGPAAPAVAEDTSFTVDYQWTGGRADATEGSGSLTVYNDGAAVSSDPIPEGASVSLSEQVPTAIPGIIWGAPSFTPSTFTMNRDTPVQVLLENPTALQTGAFTLTKTVGGPNAGLVPTETEFSVTYSWTGGISGSDGQATMTVKNDGTSVTSAPIPVNATVTLEETTPPTVDGIFWAEPSFSPSTFDISTETPVEVTLTNPTLPTGTFSIVKKVVGDGADLVAADAAFLVHYSWSNGTGPNNRGEGTVTVRNDGTAATSGAIPEGAVVELSELTPERLDGVTWGTPIFSDNSVTVSGGESVRIELTNVATVASPSAGLATTGSSTDGGMLGLAFGALIVGAILVAMRRRTRQL
ncbi:hypothetical protein FB560_1275 [Microbacterium saperdae]|uniref:LPXTG-motif cell wall-anchored protein n=1 Tax=Microbacterium saperdae TaxID=69368 RepID=A0A543BLD0_9MICO|nr:hypothetical protein FB560_1275 [Microbacterium saperdae]